MGHYPGTGRWYAPDYRSLHYAYTKAPRRKSVLHNADGPILDQSTYGACVGFTCADLLNTARFAKSRLRGSKTRRYMGADSGFGFYHYATILDDWPDESWPPDDLGSSVTAGAKAMHKSGYIDRYEWALEFDHFLGALERQPVMLGTLWTSGMDDPDAKGLIAPTGRLVGGHAYMAFGINYATERIRCRNHWTDDWAADGDFYVSFADMQWLIQEQGEVVVPVPA